MILTEHTLSDGRHAYVLPMTYGKARLYVDSLSCPLSIDAEY